MTKIRLASLPLVLGALGTGIFYRGFVQLKLGPLYPLEWLYLAWLAVVVATGAWRSSSDGFFVNESVAGERSLRTVFRGALGVAAAFFLWGSVCLLSDLAFRMESIASWTRWSQHALVFIYPLLWISAGIWIAAHDRAALAVTACALLILASLSGGFLAFRHFNYSIGFLPILLFMSCLDGVWHRKERRRWSDALGFSLVLVTGVLTFLPLSRAWYAAQVQRLSFVLFIFMGIATPFVLNRSRLKVAFKQAGIALILVALSVSGAIVAASRATSATATNTVSGQIDKALRHGDDLVLPPGLGPEERRTETFRDRRYWWTRAFEDGASNRVFGIGFGPEIPSEVRPGVKNDGQFDGAPDLMDRIVSKRPISGPHNSYLGVLTRMGVVGAILLICLVSLILRNCLALVRMGNADLTRLVLFFCSDQRFGSCVFAGWS